MTGFVPRESERTRNTAVVISWRITRRITSVPRKGKENQVRFSDKVVTPTPVVSVGLSPSSDQSNTVEGHRHRHRHGPHKHTSSCLQRKRSIPDIVSPTSRPSSLKVRDFLTRVSNTETTFTCVKVSGYVPREPEIFQETKRNRTPDGKTTRHEQKGRCLHREGLPMSRPLGRRENPGRSSQRRREDDP